MDLSRGEALVEVGEEEEESSESAMAKRDERTSGVTGAKSDRFSQEGLWIGGANDEGVQRRTCWFCDGASKDKEVTG